MQRWQRLGYYVILMAPVWGLGLLALAAILPRLWRAVSEPSLEEFLYFLLFLLPAGFGLGSTALLLWLSGRRGQTAPPSDDSVAPRPGWVGAARSPDSSGWNRSGRVPKTMLRIEASRADRPLRVIQARGWRFSYASLALLPLLGAFVVIPTFESGTLQYAIPSSAPLVFSLWLSACLLWQALPRIPRTVSIVDGADALVVEHGRVRRELGLSRVLSVDVSGKTLGGVTVDAATGQGYICRLAVWIESDGRGPTPYLLFESEGVRPRERDEQRRTW